jgi:hypothetical protein
MLGFNLIKSRCFLLRHLHKLENKNKASEGIIKRLMWIESSFCLRIINNCRFYYYFYCTCYKSRLLQCKPNLFIFFLNHYYV